MDVRCYDCGRLFPEDQVGWGVRTTKYLRSGMPGHNPPGINVHERVLVCAECEAYAQKVNARWNLVAAIVLILIVVPLVFVIATR